ncbi:hypothetical protein GCM10027048_45740 [Hymenobacter coalescens]
MLGFLSRRQPTARIVHLNFNVADPVEQARRLARGAAAWREPLCLLIDCSQVNCLRTHGVAHFVSQVLLMRRTGVGLLLHNVGAPLGRLLRLLRLDAVVELTQPARLPARRAVPTAA